MARVIGHSLSDSFNSRIAETLPQEVLTKMYAPPKPDYPILAPNDLAHYDAFICGIPTRYGNFPAQWKVFVSL
jgi:NAD(P)H dehydrogenase (quinone)